jgi:aldehyde dehydrogenase (NAD+)
MENTNKFYINGEWVEPSTSETLEVINPATEEAIASIAMGGKEDVNKAVAAAKAAFESFSQTSVEERSALLGRIIECYKARMGDIAAVVSQEMGAPIGLATAAQAPADHPLELAAQPDCRQGGAGHCRRLHHGAEAF